MAKQHRKGTKGTTDGDGMSSLQRMKNEVEKATDYGYAAMRYEKGDRSTGKGDRYEERLLALVFLRCLREELVFQLSANNKHAGKFNDVVLAWRRKEEREAHMLFVQLKHKDSTSIPKSSWLSNEPKCNFGFNMYSASYKSISQLQNMDKVPCVLMTNGSLSKDSRSLFKSHEVACEPGLGLLQTQRATAATDSEGDSCYKIDADDKEAWQAVDGNGTFVQHFYLLCNQRDCEEIKFDIIRELKELLGAGDQDQCESVCVSLCESIRGWMNRKSVCLTRDWKEWQKIVREYVEKNVTALTATTTGLEYCSVDDVWSYMESCNLAWVRPPEGGTEVLLATRIHQALADQTHIMADVKHFTQLRHRILRCWGSFCPWLVIVDDGRKDSAVVLDKLLESCGISGNETGSARRLVIVSSREHGKVKNTMFGDFDVTDRSWEKLLDASVALNGESYQCGLRDLVTGVKDLKQLLTGRPALLLAVAQLAQPLRMGQEVETTPDYYVPMWLEDHHQVTADFLETLGNGDVCFTDHPSYELLQRVITSRPSVMTVAEFQSWSRDPSEIQWPLIVWSEDLETVREEFCNQRYYNSYLLKYYNNAWQMVYFYGDPERCGPYRKRNELQLNVLDAVANVVIVNGKSGMGKSMLLSHVAEEIKKRPKRFWIIRINLMKFRTVLKGTGSAKAVKESILKATLFNKDVLGDLEYELLQYSLSTCDRVVCLVDGFDEVSAKSVDKCLELLCLLAPRRGKLVVTTRPGMVKVLESQMGVFAHSLIPFSDSELETFFEKYPSNRIITVSRLAENVRDLLRNPLYARMYAKLSQEETGRYDIVTLYDAFFREKYKRLREEKFNQDLSIDVLEEEVQVAQRKHEKELMHLAAYCLLGKRHQYVPEDPKLVENVGIVYAFVGGRPVFEHRTFAEHFLAKWCFREAGLWWRWKVFRKAYQKQTLEFFLASFDCMAVRDRNLLEVVMAALLGGATSGAVARLLEGGADPGQVDEYWRNALHLVAAHDSPQAEPLVQLLRRHAGTGALSGVDQLLWWTPARYAAEHGRWAIVAALLTDGGDISHLGDFRAATPPPGELRAVFEQRGYRALFDHVTESERPSGNDLKDQVKFAVSLACGDCVPPHLLKDIGKKAEKEGHLEVGRLLLDEYHRRVRLTRFYLCVVFLLSVLMCYRVGWDCHVRRSLLVETFH